MFFHIPMPLHPDDEVKIEVVIELVWVLSEVGQSDSRFKHRACNLDSVNAISIHSEQENSTNRVRDHFRKVTSDLMKWFCVGDGE